MTVRRARGTLPLAALLLTLGSGACVKKSTHQAALGDLARVRADMQAYEEQVEAEMAQNAAERAEERGRLEGRISVLEQNLDDLQRRYEQSETRFEEARDEVDRLEVLLNERGSEYRDLQRRLQSLSAIERETRERNAIYEEVIGRFQSLIEGGRLSVAIDRGRLVIQLPQDILFESGSAALARDGQTTLAEVAGVLQEFDDRRFQVEGHTDDVPIATARFPSNWELSAARALSVVRLMVDRGVRPENISGAAYGEFQPRASNDDREGRRLNRRIEIVMLPNLDVVAGTTLPG